MTALNEEFLNKIAEQSTIKSGPTSSDERIAEQITIHIEYGIGH